MPKRKSQKDRISHVENEELRLLGDVGDLARQLVEFKIQVIKELKQIKSDIKDIRNFGRKLKND